MILDVVIADKTLTQLLTPAIVVLLTFIVVFLVAHRRGRPAPSLRIQETERATSGSNPLAPLPSNGRHVPAYPSSYETPLFLLLGPANSDPSAILQALKKASLRDRGQQVGASRGVACFERGTVLEAGGALFSLATYNNNAVNEWKKYLNHLQKRRPQRPVDGVVLTLPCADLVGQHALSSDQWNQRALQVSTNLRLMRDRFGFCFPVYVIVTQCHVIPGFKEFANSQLLSHRREIFGWSNPYNLDAPFDPEWGRHAFAYTRQILEQQRTYFFARRQNPDQERNSFLRDELFLFPTRFRDLEVPVDGFLESLFRGAGHRDALQFRGLYFSGHVRASHDNIVEEHHHRTNGHLAEFIADLFDHKIFPERALARPVDTTLAPRNREVYVAKALCWLASAVLFTGTALAWHTLSTTRQKTLIRMARLVPEMQEVPRVPQAGPAYDAIYAAQAVGGRNFQSPFLPFSLVSGLNLRLEETMPPVFDKLVYPGLHFELERRTSNLVKGRPPLFDDRQAVATLSSSQLESALAQLRGFVTGLLLLEDDIVLFNRLPPAGAGNGSDLVSLAGNMSPSIFADVPRKPSSAIDAIVAYYSGAPKGHYSGVPFDGRPWNILTVNRLETMVTNVLRQRMNEDLLQAALDETIDRTKRLEEKELDTYPQLDGLRRSLAQVQSQLAAPDLEWVAKNEFQLPPDIRQSLAPVFSRTPEQNVLLCDVQREVQSCTGLRELQLFIEGAAHAHFLDFRAKLLSAQTNITGDLITAEDGKLQLSPGAVRLQTVLDSFLKLPFVAHEGTAEIQDVESGQQLFWNNSKLQEALQDKAAYDKFFSDDLANTPDSLQDALGDVALDRLEASMADAVASAEQFQPLPLGDNADQHTAAEARTFATVAQPLLQLLDQFSQLNFDDAYQDLSRVSSNHALTMLSRIDRFFDGRSFYWPPARNFDSWTSDGLPSTAGYATRSLDDMMAYLTLQRQDLQPYIASAKPLATFLQQRSPKNQKQSALIAKWLGIVTDAQKYESAPASSSLSSLENYLAIEMDKTAPPDCLTSAPPAVPAYFAQTQRSLARAVSVRCHALAHSSGNAQYTQLAQFFNQHLAGKFPFSAPTAEGSPEADPGDLVELFRLLDVGGKALHESLQDSGNTSRALSPQTVFVSQLEALRPFFASLFSGQPDQAPAWDFTPTFRVNRGHEINGNQIIDWTLVVGNTTFRNWDPPKSGHWSFGQPVTLTLRWAKNSPNRPIAITPANDYPETKTVVYEYHDPWALLSMLIKHAAMSSDFDRKVDPDPQTLAFTIGQQIVPELTQNGRQSSLLPGTNQTPGPDVKVFVGIRLYAPGKTTGLRLPAFPVQAPAP